MNQRNYFKFFEYRINFFKFKKEVINPDEVLVFLKKIFLCKRGMVFTKER